MRRRSAAGALTMIAREALRYLAAGGANTLVTWALYLGLLQVLDYRLAYVLAFVAGPVSGAWGSVRAFRHAAH